jgi:hypothetical protein
MARRNHRRLRSGEPLIDVAQARKVKLRVPYSPKCREDVFSEVAGRGVYTLCSGSERGELAVHRFLDGLVRGTKTVMTRVDLAGMLYLLAVTGVLLTSRKEERKW